jgi:hypothetical protein
VAACRELIWQSLAGLGVRRDDPETWPALAHIDRTRDGRRLK